MSAQIDIIISEIQNKGQVLVNGIQQKINGFNLPDSKTQIIKGETSSPSRPFYIGGGAALLFSVARGLFSSSESSSFLTYSSLLASAACFGWGYKTQKEHEEKVKMIKSQIVDFDAVRQKCKNMVNEIVDATSKEWNRFMDEEKMKVQHLIDASSLSPEEKSSAKSLTYMYQELILNTKSVIDDLNNIPDNSSFSQLAKNVMLQFSDNCKKDVMRTLNEQIETYRNIKL